MALKKRFVKDSKFFQDYLKFMENLLKNGYARRSDATPSGRTWYSLITESTTQANLGKSVLCLTAVQNSKEIASTRSYYQLQTCKSDYWCLEKMSRRINCLHGRCRSHVLSSSGSRVPAVTF